MHVDHRDRPRRRHGQARRRVVPAHAGGGRLRPRAPCAAGRRHHARLHQHGPRCRGPRRGRDHAGDRPRRCAPRSDRAIAAAEFEEAEVQAARAPSSASFGRRDHRHARRARSSSREWTGWCSAVRPPRPSPRRPSGSAPSGCSSSPARRSTARPMRSGRSPARSDRATPACMTTCRRTARAMRWWPAPTRRARRAATCWSVSAGGSTTDGGKAVTICLEHDIREPDGLEPFRHRGRRDHRQAAAFRSIGAPRSAPDPACRRR